jgi:hypothetical protein
MTGNQDPRGSNQVTRTPTALLDTHPMLGLAQWEARWQQDLTGDYPGQQFCEILRHEHTAATCGPVAAEREQHRTRCSA